MTVEASRSSRLALLLLLIQLLAFNYTLNGLNAERATSAFESISQPASGQLVVGGAEAGHRIQEQLRAGLDFKSIAEFRSFLQDFKSILATSENETSNNEKKLSKKQLDKLLRDARSSQMAIIELEPLIHTKNVCDPQNIDALVAYHRKHLSGKGFFWSQKPAATQRFFTKLAIQIAHVCKQNLVANLEMGRDELRARSKVFDEARDKVFNDEPSIKANVKLIEEQPDDPASTNLKPRDDVELTLSEYREALVELRRLEDILTFERGECANSKNRHIRVAQDKINTFFKPALMCHQLARFYSGSVLSIARLANIGYVAVDEELDLKLSDNLMVRDWIIAVQVCEPMLYMRTQSTENGEAIVDTCSERVSSIETMVYEDNFDEFNHGLLLEMIPKSEATRGHAQKLMRSAMKKMAKANLLKQLSSANDNNSGMLQHRKPVSIFGKTIKLVIQQATAPMFASEKSTNDRAELSRVVAEKLVRDTIESSRLSSAASSGSPKSAGQTDGSQADWQPDEETIKSVVGMLGAASSADESRAGVAGVERNNDDVAVAAFDPISSVASFITVIAIMLTFEWLFFIVMTLAARICHQLYFNFDNLLTFPPKVLSWSDADFARFNDKIEKMDDDDLFDYDELTPDEQRQRELLAKVFGKPPPMIYRE